MSAWIDDVEDFSARPVRQASRRKPEGHQQSQLALLLGCMEFISGRNNKRINVQTQSLAGGNVPRPTKYNLGSKC